MSQFRICDVRDVTKLPEEEIREWIDSHKRSLIAGDFNFIPVHIILGVKDLYKLKNKFKKVRH